MKKFIALSLLGLVVLSGCGATKPAAAPLSNAPAPSVQPAAPSPAVTAPVVPAGLTLADVAKHATASDCWLIVSDKVYDVTSYVNEHPGGPAILKGCGKEATALFQGVDKHAGSATDMLTQFYKADLQK